MALKCPSVCSCVVKKLLAQNSLTVRHFWDGIHFCVTNSRLEFLEYVNRNVGVVLLMHVGTGTMLYRFNSQSLGGAILAVCPCDRLPVI